MPPKATPVATVSSGSALALASSIKPGARLIGVSVARKGQDITCDLDFPDPDNPNACKAEHATIATGSTVLVTKLIGIGRWFLHPCDLSPSVLRNLCLTAAATPTALISTSEPVPAANMLIIVLRWLMGSTADALHGKTWNELLNEQNTSSSVHIHLALHSFISQGNEATRPISDALRKHRAISKTSATKLQGDFILRLSQSALRGTITSWPQDAWNAPIVNLYSYDVSYSSDPSAWSAPAKTSSRTKKTAPAAASSKSTAAARPSRSSKSKNKSKKTKSESEESESEEYESDEYNRQTFDPKPPSRKRDASSDLDISDLSICAPPRKHSKGPSTSTSTSSATGKRPQRSFAKPNYVPAPLSKSDSDDNVY